jgi:hypothetical protein
MDPYSTGFAEPKSGSRSMKKYEKISTLSIQFYNFCKWKQNLLSSNFPFTEEVSYFFVLIVFTLLFFAWLRIHIRIELNCWIHIRKELQFGNIGNGTVYKKVFDLILLYQNLL